MKMKNRKAAMDELMKIILWIIFFLIAAGGAFLIYKLIFGG